MERSKIDLFLYCDIRLGGVLVSLQLMCLRLSFLLTECERESYSCCFPRFPIILFVPPTYQICHLTYSSNLSSSSIASVPSQAMHPFLFPLLSSYFDPMGRSSSRIHLPLPNPSLSLPPHFPLIEITTKMIIHHQHRRLGLLVSILFLLSFLSTSSSSSSATSIADEEGGGDGGGRGGIVVPLSRHPVANRKMTVLPKQVCMYIRMYTPSSLPPFLLTKLPTNKIHRAPPSSPKTAAATMPQPYVDMMLIVIVNSFSRNLSPRN